MLVKFQLRKISNLHLPNFQGKTQDSTAKPNSHILNAWDFEKILRENKIEYDSVKEEQETGSVIVKLKNNTLVIFSSYKDINWQISSLHNIISRLTIENRVPKRIDFTFDKTIVNF